MSFSSLYIGATGAIAYGDGMQTVGNNLANVNTTAYKHSDTLFQTLISKQMATGSAPAGTSGSKISQMGMGVRTAAVKTCFKQGGLENTTTATDMALSGEGFFGVRDAGSGDMFYTRDGTFRFDNEGYLLNSAGLRVQGAAIDRLTGSLSAIGDVVLPMEDYTTATGETYRAVISSPKATESMMLSTNLDFTSVDQVSDAANPFFSLVGSWNGLNEDPLVSAGYTTSMKVYDEGGESHELTFYFDKVDASTLTDPTPGYQYWEYMVAIDPDEDGSALAGTSSAGLVSCGTLAFNRDGLLMNQTAYALTGGADGSVLSNWSLAGFDADGGFTFDVTFAPTSGGGGGTQTIGYTMGVTSSNGAWLSGGASNAAGVGTNVQDLAAMDGMFRDAYGTTNYNNGSMTLIANQDGYAQGFLQSLSVADDGTLVGEFSNGQSEGLFKVGVYRFTNEFGLRREGGNLFSATQESGAVIEGFAQENGSGKVYGSSLEMSNADMANEFVEMILFQRGIQANTKVITTSDSLLQTAISIKR
ncbi:MAG: flagellar hook protein FlgE [Desulfovibrionaceae bacterium]